MTGSGERDDDHDCDNLKPPPLRSDTAAADAFCDLVLTGGVTSGIVYPLAVLELARRYRFHAIGGSSAGAMAAALAAAAELQRRHGSVRGFEVLRRLPEELAAPVADGRSRLLSLFQPAPGVRRLFDLFLRLLPAEPAPGDCSSGAAAARQADSDTVPTDRTAIRAGAGLPFGALSTALLGSYAGAAVAGLAWVAALLVLLWFTVGPAGWLGSVLALLLGPAAAVLRAVWADLTGALVANHFGACTGLAASPGSAVDAPGLTDWLHRGLQLAAGRPVDAAPLCFGDLWTAPGAPSGTPPGTLARSIDLRMVTTNLAFGRPMQLPPDEADPGSRLYFHPDDLLPFFPTTVIAHLVAHSRLFDAAADGADVGPSRSGFRRLPAADLPVLVAARLSLSFPLLFAAVPLWAVDAEAPVGQRTLRRCWFSDGGICSNFPIHLFDAALPRWPTFGISLGARSRWWPHRRQAVWLPPRHDQGMADSWLRFDENRGGAARLGGFLASVFFSAKDWRDHSQMRLPGVRDRVVRIGFLPGEGELNLAMGSAQMRRIARLYGRRAGRHLVRRFAEPIAAPGTAPTGIPGGGWPEHRWVRFNTFCQALRARLAGFGLAAGKMPGSPALADQIRNAFVDRPLAGNDAAGQPLSAAQADALLRLQQALADCESAFAAASTPQPYMPTPEPGMTLRPPV